MFLHVSSARFLTQKLSLRVCFLTDIILLVLYTSTIGLLRLRKNNHTHRYYPSPVLVLVLVPALPLPPPPPFPLPPLLPHLNSLPTIHQQTRTIHEPRHVRAEEHDRIGNVVRQAYPLDRGALGPGMLLFGRGELMGVYWG
jgi:hypothetical protein